MVCWRDHFAMQVVKRHWEKEQGASRVCHSVVRDINHTVISVRRDFGPDEGTLDPAESRPSLEQVD